MADGTSLAGTWAYRSYLNQADQRVFGGGIFTFVTPTPATLTGTLVMSPTLVLDLEGTIAPATSNTPLTVRASIRFSPWSGPCFAPSRITAIRQGLLRRSSRSG
jgi:hypothetical protein